MVLVSSCSPKFREDLSQYINNFSLDYCINHYKEASLTYRMEVKENDIVSTQTCTYEYSYLEDGNYHSTLYLSSTNKFVNSESPALREESIVSNHDDEKTYTYAVHKDDLNAVQSISQTEVFDNHIRNFFYTAKLSEYTYTKGMYYGDDIKTLSKGQQYMRIDKETNHFIFERNNFEGETGNIGNTFYEVNEHGMLLKSLSSGKNKEGTISYSSELVIIYKNVVQD